MSKRLALPVSEWPGRYFFMPPHLTSAGLKKPDGLNLVIHHFINCDCFNNARFQANDALVIYDFAPYDHTIDDGSVQVCECESVLRVVRRKGCLSGEDWLRRWRTKYLNVFGILSNKAHNIMGVVGLQLALYG